MFGLGPGFSSGASAHFCDNIYSGFRTFLINFTSIHGVYCNLQWFVQVLGFNGGFTKVGLGSNFIKDVSTLTIFVLHTYAAYIFTLFGSVFDEFASLKVELYYVVMLTNETFNFQRSKFVKNTAKQCKNISSACNTNIVMVARHIFNEVRAHTNFKFCESDIKCTNHCNLL